MRYSLDMIYTYSANILIACNPHKRLRTLYGGKMMRQYKDKQLGELAPHVYAIAEQVQKKRTVATARCATNTTYHHACTGSHDA